jgi:hypothetical protein
LVATTGVVTVLVQAGAAPVHRGSPPPATVTALTADGVAEAATSTGTVMTMLPMAAPVAMVQPARLLPLLGQPLSVPPVADIAVAFNVIPVGNMSDSVIGAVVALPDTAMVMMYV